MNAIKSISHMAESDRWNSRDSVYSFLAQHLTQNSLSLVLGAGVSFAFGLPSWNQLIINMEQLKGKCPGDISDNLDKAEWLKNRLDYEVYKQCVRDALYKNSKVSFNNLSKNLLLNAIIALSIPSHRGHVQDIITFNFDDIVEKSLSYYGFIAYSYRNGNEMNKQADVNVYHIHGYLSCDKKNSDPLSDNIILDRSSYDRLNEMIKWEWYTKVVNVLQSNICIFIGLSGDDENMDRFLKKAKKEHAALKNQCAYWGIAFIKDSDGTLSKRWKKWGIYPINVKSYEKDIPNALFNICQKASEIKKNKFL